MPDVLSGARQRHASMETVARSEPLIIFHAPCVSPPATTMLISDASKIVITSSLSVSLMSPVFQDICGAKIPRLMEFRRRTIVSPYLYDCE